MILSKRKLFRNSSVVLCALVVFASGNSYITNHIPVELLWPALLVIGVGLSLFRRQTFSRDTVLLVAFLLALTGLHVVMYGRGEITAALGFMTMVAGAFFAASYIDNFPKRYVEIMTILALISLLFYGFRVGGVIGQENFGWVPGSVLENGWIHVGIFNFQRVDEAHRNSGPFWEPGAFAGYLVLALLVSMRATEVTARWKIAVLTLALLTTFSTTGYLAALVVLFLFLFRRGGFPSPIRMISTVGVAVVAMLMALMLYSEIPFLKDKVEAQTHATNMGYENYEITRYGSMLYDFSFIAERPLLGWGASPGERQRADVNFSRIAKGQGNGATGFATKFGILALLYYLWRVRLFAVSYLGLTALKSFGVVALFLVLLFGEQFLNFPLFWCFALLPHGGARKGPIGSVAPSLSNAQSAGGVSQVR